MSIFKRSGDRAAKPVALDPRLERAMRGLGVITPHTGTVAYFENELSTGRVLLDANERIVGYKRAKGRSACVSVGGWNEIDGWVWQSRIVRRDEQHIYAALLGE